ncbi:SIT4 phosphatase-associated protein-domain-containing protein [Lentinula aff. lateritia]|uniref:SIT4 phosphatase-associated protein-domain-containing protein n=1 Tax=Lentinula aff. lateritia TaxID=2804960 RepID=A0ACC1UB17_9AGAR|nr:SIT4 phosphatase-associated protein-domain-containing protein [Lentinula aff. lateritia]
MFWRFGFHAASSIDTLLDKDDQSLLTLDNLLDEDDLLQECKSQNTRLVDYFQRVDVLRRLLGWVSGEIGAAKYPYIATEVLCSEIWSIVETCVSTHPDKLLVPFWNAVLDKLPEDLRFSTEKNNTHAAAHFAKVNAVFLGKKPGEMLKFIQHQPSVLGRLLRHIENPPFVDLLVRIIQLDEYTYGYDDAVGVLEWLSSERLIPRLIDMLSPAYPPDIHQVVSDLIKGIISMATPSPGAGLASNSVSSNQFARELAREDSVSKLVAYMLQDFSTSLSESESTLSPDSVRATHYESASSSSIHAMGVLTELIRKNNSDYFEPYLFHTLRNRLIGVQQAMIQQGEGHDGETDGRSTLERAMREMVDRMGVVNLGFVLTILCDDRRLDRLVSYLRRPRSLLAESGTVVPANIPTPALTFERFRITELLAELLHCSNMALLNRPPRYSHLYDAEGRLQGGLGGLEELARVISLGNEDEDGDVHRFDGNDDMNTEIEPALELPISSASSTSNASSLLDSDEDEDMSTSSEDDSMDMEEIAMYDEPQMQSAVEPPPLSPEVDMHAAEPTESNSVPPSVSAENIGPLRQGSVSSLPTRRNSRRSTLPSASASSAEASLVVGERLKKRFLELNVLGVLLDLFFEFPWNNFLHNAVYDILHQILTGQVDTKRRSEGSRGYNRELILSLFRDAQLMYRIVEGQRRNDEESAKPRTPRLGYMGHLTLISEDVLTALDRYPDSLRDEIMQYAPRGLDTEHGKGSWDEYVTGRYRETKVRDTRLLGGGKPAVGLSGINSGGGMGDMATKWKVDEEEMGGMQATVGTASSPALDNKPISNEMRGEFRRSVSSKPRREGSADFGVAPTTMDDDDDFVAGHRLKRFDDDDDDDEEGWLSQSSTFSAMSERRPLGVNGFDDDFGPFTAPTASSSSNPSNSDDPFPSFSSSFTDEMALEGMDNLDDSAFDDNFGDFGDFGEFQTGGTAPNSSEPPSLSHPTVDIRVDGEESLDGELTPTAGSWISDLSASEGSLGSISSSIDSISSPEGVNAGLDLTGTGVETSENTEQTVREAKH